MTWAGESEATQSGIMTYTSAGSPGSLVGTSDQLIKWKDGKAEFVSGTEISGIPIDNLSDVDTTTNPADNGDMLTWDGSNWVPAGGGDTGQINTTFVSATGINASSTSATFADIPSMSGAITLSNTAEIFSILTFETESGAAQSAVGGFRIKINGNNGTEHKRALSGGGGDFGIGAIQHQAGPFPSGDYVVRAQFRRVSGNGTVVVNAAQLFIEDLEGAIGPSGVAGPAGADGADGADGGDFAVIAISNSTQLASPLPTSFTDVTFDTTDFENRADIIEHDNTNTDRINIKKTGIYRIEYYVEGEIGSNDVLEFRVRKNDTAICSGTQTQTGGQTHAGTHEYQIAKTAFDTLASGDFLSLQVAETVAGTSNIDAGHQMIATLLEGAVGPSGAQGTPGVDGSGITIQDEGISIAGNPYNILNFTGAAVTATQNGSVANISIPGGGGSAPLSFIAEAAGDITTTSTSDVLATSMTLTPSSGTYAVSFTTSVENDSSGASTFINIYQAGTIVSASERQRTHNRTDDSSGLSATARVTVNGSQAIEGRWRVSSNQGTMHERTLLIIEVTEG
jgi:hypothetical protein